MLGTQAVKQLLHSLNPGKRWLSATARLNESPLKFKNVPVYSFVTGDPSKKRPTRSKERLYVWGYAGLGALGRLPKYLD